MSINSKNIPEFFNKIVCFVFAFFSFIFFISKSFIFINSFSKNNCLFIISIILLIISFFSIILFYNKIKDILVCILNRIRKISYKKMFLLLFLLSLITKAIVIVSFRVDSSKHSDIERYWSFINQLRTNGVITENVSYATRYSYTLMYSTFFYPLILFDVKHILVYNLYLAFLMSVASVLLFDLIKYYKGKNIAFVSILIFILHPICVLQPVLLVHENSLIILNSISIWLLYRVFPSCNKKFFKVLSVISALLLLSYASTINKFGIVSIIAVILVFITCNLNNNSFKLSITRIILFLIIVIISYGVVSLSTDSFKKSVIESYSSYVIEKDEKNVPYGWPFYVGMNFKTHGEYNVDDAIKYFKYDNSSNVDVYQYKTSLIKNRVLFYYNSPVKLLKHIIEKYFVIFGDFNPLSYEYGEGWLNDFFLYCKNGFIYSFFIRTIYYINYIISIVFLLSIKNLKNNKTDVCYIDFMKLFVIGVSLILLFTEVTPKYSSHMFFMLIILAINSLKNFDSNLICVNGMISKCKTNRNMGRDNE